MSPSVIGVSILVLGAWCLKGRAGAHALRPAHEPTQSLWKSDGRMVAEVARRLADLRTSTLGFVGRIGIGILDHLDRHPAFGHSLKRVRQCQDGQLRNRGADVVGLPA